MAAKGSKKITEPLQRLSESQTRLSLNSKIFHLNEMAIGRAQKFLLKLGDAFEYIKESLGKKGIDINNLDIRDLLIKGGDAVFEKLTEIFNFLMEYRNDKYDPVDIEWAKENLTFGDIKMIGEEIAEQNRMGWLIPFFRERWRGVIENIAT